MWSKEWTEMPHLTFLFSIRATDNTASHIKMAAVANLLSPLLGNRFVGFTYLWFWTQKVNSIDAFNTTRERTSSP